VFAFYVAGFYPEVTKKLGSKPFTVDLVFQPTPQKKQSNKQMVLPSS